MLASTGGMLILLIYPLFTLKLNRILDTVISRKVSNRSLLSDLKDMYKIGGHRALYAGFIPFMISQFIMRRFF